MILEVGCTTARATVATNEEREWLRQYLVFRTVSFKGGRPHQEQTRLWSPIDGSFPQGLVHLVKRNSPTKVEVHDLRPAPSPDSAADVGWLRDYQLGAAKSASDKRRGILAVATGGGKTEIACALARMFPVRWGFLVHRAGLVNQAADRYERRCPELNVGRVREGEWLVPKDPNVVCASFQSLHAGLKSGDPRTRRLLQSFEGIVCDESHTVGAETYEAVAQACTNAHLRIGLSGTPMARSDRRSVLVVATLGPVIHTVTTTELVERGVLAKPRVRMVPVTQTAEYPTYQGAYGGLVVRGSARNAALVRAAQRCEKPAFLFVKEIGHGKALVKYLQRAGVKAEFTWGEHSAEWQARLIKNLERGALEVLVTSVVMQEGIDVPCLRSVIIGSSGKSIIASIQRVGRGTRKEEGKDEFWVYDIDDRGCDVLERHSKERAAAYRREGYEVVYERGEP